MEMRMECRFLFFNKSADGDAAEVNRVENLYFICTEEGHP